MLSTVILFATTAATWAKSTQGHHLIPVRTEIREEAPVYAELVNDPNVDYLHEDELNCWATGNLVHLEFAVDRDVPPEAEFRLYRRAWLRGDSPDSWEILYSNKVAALPFPLEIAVANADRFEYDGYVTWTPGPGHVPGAAWRMNFLAPEDGYDVISYKVTNEWRRVGSVDTVGREGPCTVKDYVQRGLIAIFDGIENAGYGRHSDAITEWRDLISGAEFVIPAEFSVTSNGIDMIQGVGSAARDTGAIEQLSKNRHVEIEQVYSIERTNDFLYSDVTISVRGDIVMVTTNNASANFDYYLSRIESLKKNNYDLVTDVTLPHTTLAEWRDSKGDLLYLGDFNPSLYYSRTVSGTTSYYSTYGGFSRFLGLNGRAHCIRIYNVELTADEVRHNQIVDRIRYNHIARRTHYE